MTFSFEQLSLTPSLSQGEGELPSVGLKRRKAKLVHGANATVEMVTWGFPETVIRESACEPLRPLYGRGQRSALSLPWVMRALEPSDNSETMTVNAGELS